MEGVGRTTQNIDIGQMIEINETFHEDVNAENLVKDVEESELQVKKVNENITESTLKETCSEDGGLNIGRNEKDGENYRTKEINTEQIFIKNKKIDNFTNESKHWVRGMVYEFFEKSFTKAFNVNVVSAGLSLQKSDGISKDVLEVKENENEVNNLDEIERGKELTGEGVSLFGAKGNKLPGINCYDLGEAANEMKERTEEMQRADIVSTELKNQVQDSEPESAKAAEEGHTISEHGNEKLEKTNGGEMEEKLSLLDQTEDKKNDLTSKEDLNEDENIDEIDKTKNNTTLLQEIKPTDQSNGETLPLSQIANNDNDNDNNISNNNEKESDGIEIKETNDKKFNDVILPSNELLCLNVEKKNEYDESQPSYEQIEARDNNFGPLPLSSAQSPMLPIKDRKLPQNIKNYVEESGQNSMKSSSTLLKRKNKLLEEAAACSKKCITVNEAKSVKAEVETSHLNASFHSKTKFSTKPTVSNISSESSRKLTKHELEQLVVRKVTEAISQESGFAEMREEISKQEKLAKRYKKKISELTKSYFDLQRTHDQLMKDLKSQNSKFIAPMKVVRNVGVQVCIPSLRERKVSKKSQHGPSGEETLYSKKLKMSCNDVNTNSINETFLTEESKSETSNIIASWPQGNNQNNSNMGNISASYNLKLANPKIISFIDLTNDNEILDFATLPEIEKPTELKIKKITAEPKRRPSILVESNIPLPSLIKINDLSVSTAPDVVRAQQAASPEINTDKKRGSLLVCPDLNPNHNHPAPLPSIPEQTSNPAWKLPPPSPIISIRKVESGITISWKMEQSLEEYAESFEYQIYAYEESAGPPSRDSWCLVGNVRAMPLPMLVALDFQKEHRYYFAVRAIDCHKRYGAFSLPQTWH